MTTELKLETGIWYGRTEVIDSYFTGDPRSFWRKTENRADDGVGRYFKRRYL